MARIPDSSFLRRAVPQARSRISSDHSGDIIGRAVEQLGETFIRINDASFATGAANYQAGAAEVLAKHKDPNFKPPAGPDGNPLTLEQSYTNDMKGLRRRSGFNAVHMQGQYSSRLDALENGETSQGLTVVRVVDFGKRVDRERAAQIESEDRALDVLQDPNSVGAAENLIGGISRMYDAGVASGLLPPDEAALRKRAFTQRAARAVIERRPPEERLEILGKSNEGFARFLTPEDALLLTEQAKVDTAEQIESVEAQRIAQLFRQDARAGARALAALDESALPPERQDGIRRKVRESVNLLRDERQAEHATAIARLEQRLATGASYGAVERDVEYLYRSGALTPTQYASALERGAVNSKRSAAEQVTREEIVGAISAGVPLDPTSEKHRDFLADAFEVDAGRFKPRSPEWQRVALAYAGQVRMLPPQASTWLRSAARSPDAGIAGTAAEFYGGLLEQSPEAAGSIDRDTKVFLEQYGGMLAAGADPQKAFETVRSNVFEARRDVVESREKAYGEHAKQTDAALTGLIDRDFDTAFRAQPAASTTLRADFERQSAAYFTKTGDIALARDLAWRDVRRIYGVSEVNGAPVVSAFPIERYGFTPAEVRGELADFLRGTGVDADDVLIVPDGLTLRAVTDALSGQAVMPSWRLVTKDGDLVLGQDGIPQRFTLSGGEELTKRVEVKRADATRQAEASIAEAKAARERLRAIEQYRRENPALTPAGGLR